MRHTLILCLFASFFILGCQQSSMEQLPPRDTQADGFVYLDGNHFAVKGERWFPMMLNYKVDWRRFGDTVRISPAFYYEDDTAWETAHAHATAQQMGAHFKLIHDWGFNCVRLCIDVLSRNEQGYFYGSGEQPIYLTADSCAIYQAIEEVLNQCDGMRFMLLFKAPMDEELEAFTAGVLRHFAQRPEIFAYDFMNEPLYFDNELNHNKEEAYRRVCQWREMMTKYAPNQLFTIGFAEPIEVFEWDPAILPVDFVEMHTYHPLRVASEMYWYGHYCGKPWMVGETALPADGDSVPYAWQRSFLTESFQCAIDNGACGYGWWEFQDCLQGVNFEAQYTGLLNHQGLQPVPNSTDSIIGSPKETVNAIRQLNPDSRQPATRPINYYNMLGYSNLLLHGKVVDSQTGEPIEGALIRGWNDDWSVGQNTFSAPDGTFTLYSNDVCTHFEISAPRCGHRKFDRKVSYHTTDGKIIEKDNLPDRTREYQSIDYRDFLLSDSNMLVFKEGLWDNHIGQADLGTIKL